MSRKFQADNVSNFKGYLVDGGEVSLHDSEYVEILDDVYGEIEVCGMRYGAGSILEGVDPVAFRIGKGDEESRLQSELEEALDREDDSDIEFIDDCDEEEDEDDDSPCLFCDGSCLE